MASKSKSNEKFNNMNILQFIEEVVKKHTTHYQSDFEIDKKVLAKTLMQSLTVLQIKNMERSNLFNSSHTHRQT